MMRHAAAPRQRGIILVAVLLAVAIMAVMVVATAALTRSGVGNEELEKRRLASHLAVRSGIEAAKALILATPEDKRLLLAGDGVRVDLGNGVTATVTLRDAAGLADLNRSDPKLIEAVAQFTGLTRAEAEGIADKITKLRADATPPSEGGAMQGNTPTRPGAGAQRPRPGTPPAGGQQPVAGEAPQPAAEKPPPVPIIFLGIDQMVRQFDIPAEDALALNTGLTVYNPTGEINPLAAPDQVLQAIPGITETDISDIAKIRKAGKGTTDSRLQQLVQRLPGMLTVRAPSVFMVEVKLDEGASVLPGSAARAVVRLVPQGQMPFGTLALEEE